MKKFSQGLIMVAFALSLVAPLSLYAWVPGDPIIPVCTEGNPITVIEDGKELSPIGGERECGFGDLLAMARNIVDVMFFFSIPIVAAVFAYAGYLYLTAMGNSGQVSKANKIFTSVLMGFVFMLSAWLIVKVIYDGLVKDSALIKNGALPVELGR